MIDISKLMLSDDELQLVTNSNWILTKRKITATVDRLLGYISEQQQQVIEKEKEWLPEAVVSSTPKIARGENYLQLPYLMLDYPRCFAADDVFAIRTMFWWGNFFSITLHLSGTYKEAFQHRVLANIGAATPEYFICINENQWQHHFEADNYIRVSQVSANRLSDVVLHKPFIKLAIKFPLQPWTALPDILEISFRDMVKLLKD